MDKILALNRIKNIEWDKYCTPNEYSPEQAKTSITNLVSINGTDHYPDICHDVQSSIGNDHCGTYYPLIFEIIDFLIEIESDFENEFVRKATYAILNNISYFEIDYGNLNFNEIEALTNKMKTKLNKYRD